MANSTVQTMPPAHNITITTGLARCASTVNTSLVIESLNNLYLNSSSVVSSVFLNVTSIRWDCNSSVAKYFEQIVIFATNVSIGVQIKLAEIYFDYCTTIISSLGNLGGFYVELDRRINMSSVTVNNSAKSDACSSAITAQYSICPSNGPTLECYVIPPNPWVVHCRVPLSTTTTPISATSDNGLLSTTAPILSSWQIGLISGLSIFALLILCIIIGCIIRRRSRSKRVTFSAENLAQNTKLKSKGGILLGQAFQETKPVEKSKSRKNKKSSVIVDQIQRKTDNNEENLVDIKPAGPYNQGTFIDHAKVHDPTLPLNIEQKSMKSVSITNSHVNTSTTKIYPPKTMSRPVSRTSTSQLKCIIDGLEEGTLDESDSISLDRSNSTNQKKPSTPTSRQLTNKSFIDESLHDEDAWMSILAVANAELDILNRLENQQNAT